MPEHVIPYAPHPGQVEFHNSKARIKVLACGARWGKDRSSVNEFIKQIIALWQFRRGKPSTLLPLVLSWIVAPTFVLCEQNWRELNYFMPSSLVVRKTEGAAKALYLPDDVIIECKSADNPQSLVSVGLDVLLVTEAGLISGLAWEQSLQPRLISPGRAGLALINGTPKGKYSWFYNLYLAGQDPLQPHIQSWTHPTFDNPYVDRAEVEGLQYTMPELWYRQEILAEWIDDGGGVFRGVRDCVGQTYQPPQHGHSYSLGVDLAKVHDFTVITVIDNASGDVVYYDRFNQIDWTLQKARVKATAARYNNAHVLLDSTGVGDPIFEDLARDGVTVEGYHFTAPSKKALIDALAIAIEQRQIGLPDEPQLINELQAFEYQISKATGTVRMNAPAGFFDDCVISLALCWWKRTHRRPATRVVNLREQAAPSGWQAQRLA